MPPILILAFVAFILGPVFYHFYIDEQQQKTALPAEKPSVSRYYQASTFYEIYEKNSVAADNQFKGNMVGIEGMVTDISTDIAGSPYVIMMGGSPQNRIRLEFDKKDKNYVASLSKGDDLVLVCTGSGILMGMPMMEHCYPDGQ